MGSSGKLLLFIVARAGCFGMEGHVGEWILLLPPYLVCKLKVVPYQSGRKRAGTLTQESCDFNEAEVDCCSASCQV